MCLVQKRYPVMGETTAAFKFWDHLKTISSKSLFLLDPFCVLMFELFNPVSEEIYLILSEIYYFV